jgi:peptide/nickel transport system ATP-binding protein
MKMLPIDVSNIEGEIFFKGSNLQDLTEKDLRDIRGPGIGMIFQDPLTSLNPVFSIGEQLIRPIIEHKNISKLEAREQAIELLKKVGISGADKRIDEYPHQFSGGQRQRIMIAGALSLRPEMLIADEPTTALDVSIQAQILKLIKELQEEFNTALLFISHNLGVISSIAHRVAAMYGGWIVEEAETGELFSNPCHPYTKALLSSVPSIYDKNRILKSLPGSPPAAGEVIAGCRLHPRCPVKISGICEVEEPGVYEVSTGHKVKCFHSRGNLSGN